MNAQAEQSDKTLMFLLSNILGDRRGVLVFRWRLAGFCRESKMTIGIMPNSAKKLATVFVSECAFLRYDWCLNHKACHQK